MGLLADIGRAVFGSGSTPAYRPAIPSTRELDKQKKRKAKEAAASAANRRAHRARVFRGDV